MQKYTINNGNRYISKISSKQISFSSSPAFAIEMSFAKARNVILSNKISDEYYIEGVSDFVRITREELINIRDKNKNDIPKTDNCPIELFTNIDDLVKNICSLKMPDNHTLLMNKEKLVNSLSYFDQAEADIAHWIQEHKPPAHIRTKVYTYMQKYRKYHTETKEKIRYIDILLEYKDKKHSLVELSNKLKEAKTKPYKPNTPIYTELNAL